MPILKLALLLLGAMLLAASKELYVFKNLLFFILNLGLAVEAALSFFSG